MDAAEFQRALVVVLVVGVVGMGIGVTAVALVLRGFGGAKAGGTRHMVLIAATLAFILLCCAALFILSYR